MYLRLAETLVDRIADPVQFSIPLFTGSTGVRTRHVIVSEQIALLHRLAAKTRHPDTQQPHRLRLGARLFQQ